MPEVLSAIQEVGVVKEEMLRTRQDMAEMISRMSKNEIEVDKARKELKRVRRDSKSLFADLEILGIQVADERIKMSVYFDAVR